MLNELLILRSSACPLCGRYTGPMPRDNYWCPYCGTSLNTLALNQLNELIERVDALEETLQNIVDSQE